MAMNQFVQDRRPQREATTVIPLTCYQVKTADVMQGDQYKANGRVLHQVTVVGIVKEFKAEGNNVTIKVYDAQGHECIIQKWGTDVEQEFSENSAMSAEERKYMVRATGHVRSIKGVPGLMATRINLVQHFEEFMAHHLHASYTLQYHKHGPLSKPKRPEDATTAPAAAASPTPAAVQATPGTEESADKPMTPETTDAVPPPQLTPVAEPEKQADPQLVRKAIMALTAGKDDGVHKDAVVQNIITSVKFANNIGVRKEIESMVEAGDLFTTKDAFHIAS